MLNFPESEYPYQNKTMTTLDTRVWNLLNDLETLKNELWRDRYYDDGSEKPYEELTMICHMNVPCDVSNLYVTTNQIARLLNKNTHNGK